MEGRAGKFYLAFCKKCYEILKKKKYSFHFDYNQFQIRHTNRGSCWWPTVEKGAGTPGTERSPDLGCTHLFHLLPMFFPASKHYLMHEYTGWIAGISKQKSYIFPLFCPPKPVGLFKYITRTITITGHFLLLNHIFFSLFAHFIRTGQIYIFLFLLNLMYICINYCMSECIQYLVFSI